MKVSFRFFIFFLSLTLVLTCDSNNVNMSTVISCDDGVQNGDETGIDCGGSCPNLCPPENAIFGEVLNVLSLTSNIEYVLTGPLLVRDGAELLIQPGTVIKAQPNSNAYIAIAQGGRIFAFGTKDDPIVFTSNSTTKAPGDWGGILLFGQAPLNTEVLDRSDMLDLFYGGTNADDYSGVMQYVRIEYAGGPYTSEKNFNGLSFYGVGSFTALNNIQIFQPLGDGISCIGGTVNLKNIVINDSQENGITFQDGWNGSVENLFISNAQESGIQISNNLENAIQEPITTGSIDNASLIAPFSNGGIALTNGAGNVIMNELFTTGLNLGIHVNGTSATSVIDMMNFEINTIEFESPTIDFIPTNYMGSNPNFFSEGSSFGAGNKDQLPDWTQNWVKGF